MKIPKLIPVKIYHAGDFKKDEWGSREQCMMFELCNHIRHNMIGIVTFKDGHTESMGNMNFSLGCCDCCPVNVDDIESVAVYMVE